MVPIDIFKYMTLVVSPLQVAKFRLTYDENRPNKVSVKIEDHVHFVA
jgi:hypothetical protein